jgi:hypothetical protein
MRKTIAMLFALAGLAASAQPALADNPAATTTNWDYGNGVVSSCTTPDARGDFGAFGAWGFYIDGCTVRLTCPAHLSVCAAKAESRINTRINRGQRVTLNSRMRAFSRGTEQEFWHRDVSCDKTDWCSTEDLVYIRGGESASVQCNGVRESADNRAMVDCTLDLRYQ